jgi:hypothetical protein
MCKQTHLEQDTDPYGVCFRSKGSKGDLTIIIQHVLLHEQHKWSIVISNEQGCEPGDKQWIKNQSQISATSAAVGFIKKDHR